MIFRKFNFLRNNWQKAILFLLESSWLRRQQYNLERKMRNWKGAQKRLKRIILTARLVTPLHQELMGGEWWRSRHRFEGSRSSTNWASYESTSKEVQWCTQRTHPRVMGLSKFVEAHWAWSTRATKNRHLDSSSRRIRSRLRIGKKYFGSILQGSGCMAILGATFFPFMLSFVSFYMTLGVQPLLPYMSYVF